MENIKKHLSQKLHRAIGGANDRFKQVMKKVYADPDVKKFVSAHQSEISREDLARSASRLYEFVNEKHQVAAGQPGVLPGYVPYLVLDEHTITVNYRPTKQKLAQEEQAAIDRRVRSVNMSKQVRRANLADFYYNENESKGIIIDAATKFAEAYHEHPDKFHRGMYIYGAFGIGKTYLLAALANRLAKLGIQTTLVHFPTFATEMKAAIKSNATAEKIDELKKSPVLMLDDIGADDMSAWIRDDVLSVILEYRMQNELSTFFSSNYSMNELAKDHLAVDRYGNQAPLKAGRIMERIHFLAKEYLMKGKNHRNPDLNK